MFSSWFHLNCSSLLPESLISGECRRWRGGWSTWPGRSETWRGTRSSGGRSSSPLVNTVSHPFYLLSVIHNIQSFSVPLCGNPDFRDLDTRLHSATQSVVEDLGKLSCVACPVSQYWGTKVYLIIMTDSICQFSFWDRTLYVNGNLATHNMWRIVSSQNCI